MQWGLLDLPPGTIIKDGKPDGGMIDAVVHSLVAKWPEVDHEFIVMTPARVARSLEDGSEICFPNLIFTPERDHLGYFSQNSIVKPHRLIVRSEVVSQLPKNAIGEVLPSTLFDNPHLRGLLNPNRSYSPLLDTLIKRRGANAQITMVSPSMGGANILKMLTLNRGDYTIEYDFGFAYQMSLDPSIAAANLQSLPIAGGVTSPSGCFCPRTEWGRAAIQKIDSLMVKIAADPELRNAYYRWLTPETVKSYRPELEQFFRDRLRPTNPAKFAPP